MKKTFNYNKFSAFKLMSFRNNSSLGFASFLLLFCANLYNQILDENTSSFSNFHLISFDRNFSTIVSFFKRFCCVVHTNRLIVWKMFLNIWIDWLKGIQSLDLRTWFIYKHKTISLCPSLCHTVSVFINLKQYIRNYNQMYT